MKVLLEIGYTKYLLPSDTGLTTVLKALSQAVEVRDCRAYGEGIKVQRPKPEEVKISYVTPAERIVWPDGAAEVERPQKAKRLALRAPSTTIIPPYHEP